MMNRIYRIAYFGLLICLAGCSSLQSLNSDWINQILYTPTPTAAKPITVTPPSAQATEPSTGQPLPAASAQPQILRVWLPPQFDPETNNAAAALLKQRLNNFEAEHPGLEVEVRIKAEQGEADLLNSLSVTSMAAPSALPDLVALPRPMLEVAVQKGLIRPLGDLSSELTNPDVYPYARDLGKIDGTAYGIPFAGDATVIIYRPELVWIKTWDDILLSEGHLIFPGADPQAGVALTLYESAGGPVLDAQGNPTLDQEILTSVLELFAKGRAAALFPDASANIATDTQVLQEYRARRANMAIVHFSSYRVAQDGLLQPLMGLKKQHFTFATGWLWALAGQNPQNQQLSAELVEFLTADDFLSQWTKQTGYLPTRAVTTDQAEDSPIRAVVQAAQPLPSRDLLAVLGPVMQDAVVRVLNGEQPQDVARSSVEKLK